ncbi:MAG: hypothetical protein Q9197_002509 [Variospora fuerteventurae]
MSNGTGQIVLPGTFHKSRAPKRYRTSSGTAITIPFAASSTSHNDRARLTSQFHTTLKLCAISRERPLNALSFSVNVWHRVGAYTV